MNNDAPGGARPRQLSTPLRIATLMFEAATLLVVAALLGFILYWA